MRGLMLMVGIVVMGTTWASAQAGLDAVQAELSQVAAATAVEPAQMTTGATAAEPWTYARYQAAVAASQRKLPLTSEQFQTLEERQVKAMTHLEEYLKSKFTVADATVMAAFRAVPREYFQYNYEAKYSFAGLAYEVPAKPWAIGYGSALSDYEGQAYMTQLAKPKPTDVVLEIGTGSGFQAAILSRLVKEVYSIEIIEPLGQAVAKLFAPLGYANVHTKVGDGYYGWPEVKGGFDMIMVTCAAQYVPPPLLEQLKPGGQMIIPIGPPFRGKQILYVYTKDQEGKIHSRKDVGVYFVPMTGDIQKKAGK